MAVGEWWLAFGLGIRFGNNYPDKSCSLMGHMGRRDRSVWREDLGIGFVGLGWTVDQRNRVTLQPPVGNKTKKRKRQNHDDEHNYDCGI
jgi:hypothetical protein